MLILILYTIIPHFNVEKGNGARDESSLYNENSEGAFPVRLPFQACGLKASHSDSEALKKADRVS